MDESFTIFHLYTNCAMLFCSGLDTQESILIVSQTWMIYSNLTGTKYLQNQGFLLTRFSISKSSRWSQNSARKLQAVQLETEVTEAQALRDAPAYEWWI